MRNFDQERGAWIEGPRLAGCMWLVPGPPEGESAYLRVERRGSVVLFASSTDGRNWASPEGYEPVFFELPRALKVGVIAEATDRGHFRAVFDQFKLTPLGGRPATRPVDARH
jgi:regulation of enolase protein 1 (concanavalin A-like superfamily)